MSSKVIRFRCDADDYKLALLGVIGALGRAYKYLTGTDSKGQSIISKLISFANKIKSAPDFVRSFLSKIKLLRSTSLPSVIVDGVFKACTVLARVSDRMTGDSMTRDSALRVRRIRDDGGVLDALLKATGLLSKVLPFLPEGKAKGLASSAISIIGRAQKNESAIRKSIDFVKALLGLSLPNKITFSLGYAHSLLKEAYRRVKGIFA